MGVDLQNPDYTNIYYRRILLLNLKYIWEQDKQDYVMSLPYIEKSAVSAYPILFLTLYLSFLFFSFFSIKA